MLNVHELKTTLRHSFWDECQSFSLQYAINTYRFSICFFVFCESLLIIKLFMSQSVKLANLAIFNIQNIKYFCTFIRTLFTRTFEHSNNQHQINI